MPETTEYSTTVTLNLRARGYNAEAVENRWRQIERYLMQLFGSDNFEIVLKPEWEERTVPDPVENETRF